MPSCTAKRISYLLPGGSRQEVWRKGETSGERQWIRTANYDCDGDTLLFRVQQEGGGACHTGEYSCFYRPFGQA